MTNSERPDEAAVLEEKKAVMRRVLSEYRENVDEAVEKFFMEAGIGKIVHDSIVYRGHKRKSTEHMRQKYWELKSLEQLPPKPYNRDYYLKNRERMLATQKAYMERKKQRGPKKAKTIQQINQVDRSEDS